MMIEQIREKIAIEQFEFTKHAADQSILRRISVQELREAVAGGEIIEDYPTTNTDRVVSSLDSHKHADRYTFSAVIHPDR
jgi:hypothetical protein